jgi:hypothetical protein
MRRLASVIVSIGSICAGVYLVYGELVFGLTLHSKLLPAGAALIAIGAVRLWLSYLGF